MDDVIFEGASTVLVGGLPVTALADHTVHTGAVATASGTVFVGGPRFSLPKNFAVKGDSAFQNAVIRDLYFLSTLPSGKALIARLAASGQPVTLQRYPLPHNSSTVPSDPRNALRGTPTGSTIEYNPNVAVSVYDAAGNAIPEPPQVGLAHEMTHALHNAEGTNGGLRNDPNPPASENPMREEEAATVGTGSHAHDYPTENSVRSDMGLPLRDNHYAQPAPAPTGNYRPGGY
jgi:hypothetical protein